MRKLARPLMVVAMLAAMNLAAMTAVAHARPIDDPAGARPRADATVQRLLARERFATPDTGPGHPRLLLDETWPSLHNPPGATPAQATSPARPAPPSSQGGWPIAALGGLAAVLALVATVAVVAAWRTHRSQRAEQTA
jgi:hypothetical protein